MTEVYGKQLVFELVNNLIKNNFNIKKSNIGDIDFIEREGVCGYTVFMDTEVYKLGINKRLLKDGKLNYLKCVIYHELAHIIQYNEAVSQGIIKYNAVEDCIDILCEDATVADDLVFDNLHHTAFWQKIVDRINILFNPSPKITAYLKQVDLNKFLEGFFMNDRKRRNDPVVDYTISGLTLDDMMKYDLKPEYRINEAEVLAELSKEIVEEENKNKESAQIISKDTKIKTNK